MVSLVRKKAAMWILSLKNKRPEVVQSKCFKKSAGSREYIDTERIMTIYPKKRIPRGDKSDSDISGAGGAKESVKGIKILCSKIVVDTP